MAKKPLNLKIAEVPSTSPGQTVSGHDLKGRARKRHVLILLSFFFVVLAPVALSAAYLLLYAADQYSSKAGFSVRSEEFSNPLEALSAFSGATGASNAASDSEILYDFVRSQTLVERLDAELDLKAMFAAPATNLPVVQNDWVFGIPEGASIEDLTDYWQRMVTVSRSTGTGIIDLEIRAFTPEDAQLLAQSIVESSTGLVNELSQISRTDAVRFADEDLALAEARLADIRRRIREFRTNNQIIDPEANADSQTGVLAELQTMLAETLIRRGSLESFTGPDDPRLGDLDRQIDVIRNQIETERSVFADRDVDGTSLSAIMGDYEELLVDLEFSQTAYTGALAAVEQARAEARRKTRYAAVHIEPTLAQESTYPRRWLLLGLIFVASLSMWAVATLVYYNVRDRS